MWMPSLRVYTKRREALTKRWFLRSLGSSLAKSAGITSSYRFQETGRCRTGWNGPSHELAQVNGVRRLVS